MYSVLTLEVCLSRFGCTPYWIQKDNNRAVIAKFPVVKERELALRNANRLRNTVYFITKQLTAKQRERKDLYFSPLKI